VSDKGPKVVAAQFCAVDQLWTPDFYPALASANCGKLYYVKLSSLFIISTMGAAANRILHCVRHHLLLLYDYFSHTQLFIVTILYFYHFKIEQDFLKLIL